MLDDIRLALRTLALAQGFALLTLLTLACGLGAAVYCCAVFLSFYCGEIPYPDADRLVALQGTRDGERTQSNSVHYLDYLEYSQAARKDGLVEDLLPLSVGEATLGDEQHAPESFSAAQVPSGVWPWLGQQAVMGRLLQASDEQPGAPPVALISAQVWKRFFGGSPAIIGSRVRLNGVWTTVVGVMPGDLYFPLRQQLWQPLPAPSAGVKRYDGFAMGSPVHMMVLGKLKPGVSRADFEARMVRVAEQLQASYPRSNEHTGVEALRYAQWGLPDARPIAAVLGLATSFLLTLVWINAGNLLLSRAMERRQALAVRAALGAPRSRLILQMLAESAWLNAGALLLGLFAAAWALAATDAAFQAGTEQSLQFWLGFHMSPIAVGAGLLLMAVSTLATGLPTALRLSRVDVSSVLRDGGRGAPGRASSRLSRVLVALQIALSCLLLLLAASSTLAARHQLDTTTGARMQGMLTAKLSPRLARYRGAAAAPARAELWNKLEGSLNAQTMGAPVAIATSLPGGGMLSTGSFQIEGMPDGQARYPEAGFYQVNPGYFKTLEVALLQGREFNAGDRADTLPVAVVNASFAATYWPGQNALGKRFRAAEDKGRWITVVGVIGQLLQGHSGPDSDTAANVYVPLSQEDATWVEIGLVGMDDSRESREKLMRAVAQADPDLALTRIYSAEERQYLAVSEHDVLAAWSLALGLLSLLLAASGIYGITSRAVNLRQQEIAVRRAVGATDRSILQMLMRRSLWQLAVAAPLGLAGGWLLARQGPSIGTALPLCVGLIGLLIAALVLLSTWLPARRALALSPSMALHCE